MTDFATMDACASSIPIDVPQGVAPQSGRAPAALLTGLALAACDGGSSGGMTSADPAPVTSKPAASFVGASLAEMRASRFLGQATMGATRAEIAAVQAKGVEGWIDAQLAMPRAISHWEWLLQAGYGAPGNAYENYGFDATIWRSLITEPDQLRQRVGMALLQIMVVGIDGISINWRQFAMGAYLDVLLDNAFGNFRTLLEKVTTNTAMGSFLTFLGNRKANATKGTLPDENFARELMQLFTIGLYRLNMDGTRQLSGGQPVETYTQTDVTQLARVFTGLWTASSDASTPDVWGRPMVMRATEHETGASTFLGTTVPAGTDGMTAIGIALDAIFAHPNVPPFVSKQLIQRLVTSNPSPDYVGRVAAIFANNGSGVRGDMKAVIKAILLDSEARDDAAVTNPNAGKLREPVLRLTGWARAFGATSPSNKWEIGDTSNPITRLGQSTGRSPSVFNFFRPGYTPPNSGIAKAGMVAPELQIASEVTVVAYVNYMKAVIEKGAGDVTTTYADLAAKADDAAALVDEVSLLMAAGQLSATTITAIRSAVNSIPATSPTQRIQAAILLTMASPDYLTLK